MGSGRITKKNQKQQRPLRVERLEARQMLASDIQNPGNPLDVTDDLIITARDALVIINRISRKTANPDFYYDVSGDGLATPLDALRIINGLGRQQPEITLKLGNDTARDTDGTTKDRKTFDLALKGRINFVKASPTLFAGVGDQWVNFSSQLKPDGTFELDDRTMRQLLGDVKPGANEIRLSPDAKGERLRRLGITVLAAPPQPRLIEATLDEDGNVVLDVLGNTYDPDSDAKDVHVEIVQSPASGALTPQNKTYVYRPNPNFHGTDTVVYKVVDEQDSSGLVSLVITVDSVNDVPEITPVEDKVIQISDGGFQLPFNVVDADGEPLDIVGYASVPNPLFEIQQKYELKFVGDYYENLTGLNEKWLFGKDKTSFFLLPSGDLIQWLGSYDQTGKRESLIARLDETVYEDPSLLWQAAPESILPVAVLVDLPNQTNASAGPGGEGEESSAGALIVKPPLGLVGDFTITVLADDGTAPQSQSFHVTIPEVYDGDEQERAVVDTLSQNAESLDYDNTDAFIQQVETSLPTFQEDPQNDLEGLLQVLKSLYSDTQKNIASSGDYETSNLTSYEREIKELTDSKAAFAELQTQYNAAWDAYQKRRPTGGVAANQTIPPIFIHGKDYPNPIKVARGENLTIDFQAVHPAGMRLYDFDFPGRSAGLFINANVQTGLFSWDTRATDSGLYEFQITASAGDSGQYQSSIPFKVEVIANEPAVEGVKVAPAIVSDTGTDPITLTAINPYHPRYDQVRVTYYQDIDNNQQFDSAIDKAIGSGTSWTGVPKPIAADVDSITFFAVASVSPSDLFSQGLRDELFSEPVLVTVPVMHPPKFVADSILALGDEVVVSAQSPDFHAFQMATYGAGKSVLVTDTDGLTLQRYSAVNELGIGTPVGAKVKLPYSVSAQHLVAKADQDGNVTIVYAAGSSGIDNPDNSAGSALWLIKVGSDNAVLIPPTKLLGDEAVSTEYVFAFDMNASGEGVVVAMPYYSNGATQMLTFTAGGSKRSSVREWNEVFTSYSPNQWHAVSINSQGEYVVNYGGGTSSSSFVIRGNVADAVAAEPLAVDFGSRFAAISATGWTVVTDGETLTLLDPQGLRTGKPLTIPSADNGRTVYSIRFLDDEKFELISERSTGITRQRFSLGSQPDLIASDLQVATSTLKAGEAIDVSLKLTNHFEQEQSGPTIAFFLSRDGQLSDDDRFIGTATDTEPIASGAEKSVSSSLTLPPKEDPYWLGGTESLRLIAYIPSAGQRISAALSKIEAVLPSTNEVTGPKKSLPIYPEPTQPADVPYIRTDVIAKQTSDTTYIKSNEFVELIGYQYLAAARKIANAAHAEVRDQIFALYHEMQISLERLEENRFLNEVEKNEELTIAAEAQDQKIKAANQSYSSKFSEIQRVRDEIINHYQPIVDDARAELSNRIEAERSRLQGLISNAQEDIRVLEGAAEQLLAEAERLAKKLLTNPKKILSLKDAAEDIKEEINDAKDALGRLQDQLASVTARVTARVNQEIAVPLQQIASAKRGADEAAKVARRKRDDAVNQAKSDYSKAEATINKHATAAGKTVTEVVVEQFADVVQKQAEIIKSIDSPEGLIQKVQADAKAIDQQNPFGSVEENLETVKVSAEVAKAVLGELNEKLAPVIDEFKQAGGKFSQWSKDTGGKSSDWTKDRGDEVAKWVQENIDDVLDEEVVAYKAITDFDMTLNLSNGAFYLDAKVAPGAGYDSRKLNALLESGDASIPDIDPVDAIKKLFSARLVQEDNYDETLKNLQDEFGATSVYFASRRFVDYFGGESAAEIVAETFIFGGAAAAKDAIQDLGEHLRLELNDVISWLYQKGEEQIEAVVPELLRAMLTGQDFRSPHIELKWTPVDYKYSLKPEPILGKAVAALGGDEAVIDDFVDHTRQRSRHLGFSIIWQIPNAEDPETQIENYLNDLDFSKLSGPSLTPELVLKAFQELVNDQLPDNLKLPDDAIKVLEALGPIVGEVSQFEKFLANTITDVLNFDKSDIKLRMQQLKELQKDDFVLDFKDTPVAQRLEEFLKKITFGNRRSAMITEFSFDLKTFTLRIRGEQCHKHSWGSIGDILEGIKSRV